MPTAPASTAGTHPIDLEPRAVKRSLDAGDIMLIDVRDPFEHAEARIDGAINHPLGDLDPAVIRTACAGKQVVFHCQGGKRSAKAAESFAENGEPVYHLAGGIDAWKAAGLTVETSAKAPPIPVMRQVQIVAGALVALGTALGLAAAPGFFAVPAFVGCGLMFAGLSGWCGMAKLLAIMPWNRVAKRANPNPA